PYRLTASKAGVGSAASPSVSPGDHVELGLGPQTSLTGSVITEVDSVPVPHARVTFDNGTQRFVAMCDDAGKFKVDGIVPGYYGVTAAAKGHTPLMQDKFRVQAGLLSPVTLRLPRGTRLRVKAGLVRDPASSAREPLKDVLVVAKHRTT